MFQWENADIINGLINESHDIVHILGCWAFVLLSTIVNPHVVPTNTLNKVHFTGKSPPITCRIKRTPLPIAGKIITAMRRDE